MALTYDDLTDAERAALGALIAEGMRAGKSRDQAVAYAFSVIEQRRTHG